MTGRVESVVPASFIGMSDDLETGANSAVRVFPEVIHRARDRTFGYLPLPDQWAQFALDMQVENG